MSETKPGAWPETDPTAATEVTRRATDPAIRKQWSEQVALLRERSQKADPFLYSRELLDELHRFEAAIFPTYREILGTSFLWTDVERGFMQWGKEAFHGFARSASGALRREASHDLLIDASGGELAALALAAYGNSIKWAEISSAGYDPISLVELRRIHELVERAGLGRSLFTVPR